MSPYILFEDKDDNGIFQKYILQREYPHFVGKISMMPMVTSLSQIPIPKYNLWILFAGTLRGNMMPAYTNFSEELDNVYRDMASWYYENVVLKNKEEFEKYKLKIN